MKRAAPVHRSRIHLLAARTAPVIVILQRKSGWLFHVITLDTETHAIEEGSWFRGVLHPLDSDVSFDGKFMIYRATGAHYRTSWSGVCRLPWLKTLVHVESVEPAGAGGGYFSGPNDLKTHLWVRREKIFSTDDIPFTIERDEKNNPFGDSSVGRLERDGFTRLDHSAEAQTDPGTKYFNAGLSLRPTYLDAGWGRRPAPGYPELQLRRIPKLKDGSRFAVTLDEYPNLLVGANEATWDSGNNLWVARPGIAEQYTLDDLKRGTPSFTLDVDRFEPPPKPPKETG
jgi:hypothetical protein